MVVENVTGISWGNFGLDPSDRYIVYFVDRPCRRQTEEND